MQDPDETTNRSAALKPAPDRGLAPTDLREYAGTGETITILDMTEAEATERGLIEQINPGISPETMEKIDRFLADPGTGTRRTRPEKTDPAANPEELAHWWVGDAASEAPEIARKATEYGSNSLAAMGAMIGRVQHRQPMTRAEELEYGCAVYAFGKMERVMDAIIRGDLPSEDTWRDIAVYARMARRIRETGNWP